MRQIPLTQGFSTLVDDADYDAVITAGGWRINRCDKRLYAGRWVTLSPGKGAHLRLHTFLTGWPLVDHINGDGLDNQRANLRLATGSQNNANQGLASTNTTGFKGVNWYGRTGRWRACIGINGRQIHLGYFATALAAAHAYDRAALGLFGEFARLNFPLETVK